MYVIDEAHMVALQYRGGYRSAYITVVNEIGQKNKVLLLSGSITQKIENELKSIFRSRSNSLNFVYADIDRENLFYAVKKIPSARAYSELDFIKHLLPSKHPLFSLLLLFLGLIFPI